MKLIWSTCASSLSCSLYAQTKGFLDCAHGVDYVQRPLHVLIIFTDTASCSAIDRAKHDICCQHRLLTYMVFRVIAQNKMY